MWRIGFLVYLLGTSMANPMTYGGQNVKVCDTEPCRVAAVILNKMMNKSVSPCDDFYSYACGGWDANFPPPSNEDVWNLDKMTEHNAKMEARDILEEEESDGDVVPLKYEKWWFKSCMDLDRIEDMGTNPLEEILDYNGGWPIIMNRTDSSEEDRPWQSVHEYYTGFEDLSSLFNIGVWADDRNLSRNAIRLNKPAETLYEKLLNDGDEISVTKKYAKLIKDVALLLAKSANKTILDEDLNKDTEDIINFEKNLHLIKDVDGESNDLESSKAYMTIDELQRFYEEGNDSTLTATINWLRVIMVIFKNQENITIDNSEAVGVQDTFYLQKLSRLLGETPNRVIVNYVHWKFIASSLQYLNKEMRDLLEEVIAKDDSTDDVPERWEVCKSEMKVNIGYRYEYLKRHFLGDTKKMTFDVANEMRSEMLDEVEHSTWLDDEAKEETLIKLHALKWNIGASSFQPKFLDSIYDGLTVTSNYFDNVQNAREFLMNLHLKRLRRRRIARRYIRTDPLQAMSFYEPSRNILVLTTAQVSVPLLHSTLPASVNYGYIAPTMGQLMARTMEKEVATDTYMSPWSTYLGETYKSYESKTDCLMRQYYNYSVGPATIDENMYDAIGLKVAYNAFQNNAEYENVEKLPDLEELSEEQLFFVAFAAKYCRSVSPKYLLEHLPAFYTPNEYRVIGMLSNTEYFAKAFSCPTNSPMNPENKCII